MIAVSRSVLDESIPSRSLPVLGDAGIAAAMAAARRLAVPWFQPVLLPEPGGIAGMFPRWLLLEQVRGPTLGDFVLSRAWDGFTVRMFPAAENQEREVLELGTCASVGDAVALLNDFLRQVADGHSGLGWTHPGLAPDGPS